MAEEAAALPPVRQAALRDSLAVALSNPKSLVYVVALLPPFVDPARAIAPQLAVLAAIAIACDFAVGSVYVLAGGGMARRDAAAGAASSAGARGGRGLRAHRPCRGDAALAMHGMAG